MLSESYRTVSRMQLVGNRLLVVARQAKKDKPQQVTELWDLDSNRVLRSKAGSSSTRALLFSQPHSTAVLSFGKASVELWNLETGEIVESYAEAAKGISPDGNYLLLKSGKVVTMQNGEAHLQTSYAISSFQFSSDSRFLIAKTRDGKTHIWNLADKKRVASILVRRKSVISPDGRLLGAYDASDRSVKIWDLASGALRQAITVQHRNYDRDAANPAFQSIAFSKHGKHLAIHARDQIRLANTDDGKMHTALPRAGHSGGVWSIDVSPDGALIASAGEDQTVCFWTAEDGRFLGMLEAAESPFRRVVFSPAQLSLVFLDCQETSKQ